MTWKLKNIIIVVLLALSYQVKATHIVGGDLYYTLVNATTNEYRITAQIFFDCEDGNPGAISDDDEIFISLWNARTNAFISDFTVRFSSKQRVTNDDTYKCVIPPGNVCVSRHIYTRNIIINPGNDGVIVAWQRCCRNAKIDNIIAPGATGFTAWNVIPPRNIPNNSPVINDIPPLYVCVDAPLSFSQRATDSDSLVYSFTTPFLGGDDITKIRPSDITTYDRPPFNNVSWRNGFSQTNQIPGNPSLTINSSTGEVTGTPNRTGTYTFGIAIREYRNGLLIGITRRDYQVEVINCQFNLLADFDVPGGTAVGGSYAFECGDTVTIRNKSKVGRGLQAKYFWDFGDPTTTTDTLTTWNINTPVSYVYPGNGDYTVTLKATSSICEDTYKYGIRIRSSKTFELGPDRFFCDDFATVLDTKTPDAVSVSWNSGATGHEITVSDAGTYIAEVSYGKCSYSDTISIFQEILPPLNIPQDTLICNEINFTLDAGIDTLRYQWNAPLNNTSQTVQITDTGTYSVSSFGKYCSQIDTIRVWRATQPKLEDTFFCDIFNHTLSVGNIEEAQYLWSNGVTDTISTFVNGGVHWVQITQRNCVKTDTFTIHLELLPKLTIPRDTLVCNEVNFILDAGIEALTYQWSDSARSTTKAIQVTTPGIYSVTSFGQFCSREDTTRIWQATQPEIEDSFFCNEFSYTIFLGTLEEAEYLWSNGSTNAQNSFTTNGTHWVRVTQRNCVKTDTFEIGNTVVNVDLGEDTHYCDSMNVDLDGGSDGETFLWSTGATSRGINVQKPGKYYVDVTDAQGCTRADTVALSLTNSPIVNLRDDTTICVNSPTIIDVPLGYSYLWNTGSTENYIITALEGLYNVQITDEYGCTDTDSITITVDPNALPNFLYIPNAFTPNDDTVNDWFPYTNEVIQPSFWVRVYSRWGEKVFDSSTQGTTRWDGYYKGVKVPPGVYIFMVSYSGCDGNTRTDKGTLHTIY